MNSQKNTNKRRKIALLGGSFNPAHKGHVHISKITYKNLSLNEIWWVVSPQNPLKLEDSSASFEERIKLSKEKTKNHPFIKVKDIEKKLNRNGSQFYTYNFLKRLKKLYPKYQFFFIIGADNLINFHKWYRWKDLLNIVQFIAIDRGGVSKYSALASKAYKTSKIEFLNAKKLSISSTAIRENSANL